MVKNKRIKCQFGGGLSPTSTQSCINTLEVMTSSNSSEDLFPALESLSKLIVPHIKTAIFVALVLNQFTIFPDFNVILSQISSPLIFIVALYFGGIWTLPNGQESTSTLSWKLLLGPFFDFKTISSRVGTYFKGETSHSS